MDFLPYIIIPILVPLVLKAMYSSKEEGLKKAIVILLSLLIISAIIPFYPFKGNSHNLYSVFDFILKNNDYWLLIMFLSYLASLSLLILKPHYKKFSFALFLIGCAATWLGTFINGPGLTYYDYDKFGSYANLWSALFPLFYIMFPGIIFLVFYPFVQGEKGRKKELANQIKQAKEIRKIGFKSQFIAFLGLAILTLAWGTIATYGYDTLHCLNVEDCRMWGTVNNSSAFFYVIGFLFASPIVFATGKGVTPGQAKFMRRILPIAFLLFLAGNYASFQTYTLTTNKEIRSRNFMDELFLKTQPINLGWDEIKGFRLLHSMKTSRYGKELGCDNIFFQLILNDGKLVKLSDTTRGDFDFATFLENERHLPKTDIFSPECGE